MFTCIVCNNKKHNDFYCDYVYCDNCFHIQKKSLNIVLPFEKTSYNKDVYKGHILDAIGSIKKDEDETYKILNVNDTNTDILDDILGILVKKTSKYNIKTVSISTLFNRSFFSKHNCSKLKLSDYTSDIIKKEHGTFDVIVLNDILAYTDDPLDVLKSCEKLSNENTIIFSINLHTRVFSSMKLFTMDKNINSIFNTNSMKRLCHYSGMQLSNCTIIDDWNLFTLKHGIEKDSSKIIIDTLYAEMIINIYDKELYKVLSDYLENFKYNLQNTILKYKSIDYKIVAISTLKRDFMYLNFYKDYHINSNNIVQLERFDNDEKYIIIIYDYLNFNEIKTKIKQMSDKHFLFFDICNFISYN
jgi:hypothetical protein